MTKTKTKSASRRKPRARGAQEQIDLGVLNDIWKVGGAHNLPLRLILVAKLIDRYIDRLLAEKAELSVPEWRVIAQLAMLQHGSVRKMARQASVDPAEVSRAAAALEKRGFVRREENAQDRRSAQFSLTRQGAAHFSQFRPYWEQFSTALVANLRPGDTAAIERGLARSARVLLDLLGENGT
jgi:DNA-binding MarR family transcriptional regulator